MDKYYYAKGRRKTASATIRVFEGNGQSLINEKPVESIYPDATNKRKMFYPLVLLSQMGKYYFTAKTVGGGKNSQLEAIVMAFARALVKADSENKSILKKAGLLTRDDRMVERKKTGLRKARKAPQYSKR